MKRPSRIMLAASAAALAFALAACTTPTPAETDAPTTAPLLTIGQFVEPATFDPALSQEGNLIPYYQATYDTLIKRAPDGSLEPMLATEWSYNDDLSELTLTLRDDVTFTDGAAFDAEAAKANLDNFIAAGGPGSIQASSITGVEAVDATTLVITLGEADPSLLNSLGGPLGFMVSPDAIGTDELTTTPVGSGPYTLDSAATIVGSEYTFVRNPDYWGDELPYDSIKMVLLTDETARVNALRSGQINGGIFTAPATFQELEAAGLDVQQQELDFAGFVFFDRDGALNPAFEDPNVREALTIAIDKEALYESVALGRGTLTSQIFNPNYDAYDSAFDNDDRFAYDPERAIELLDEAGYASGLTVTMPISPVFPPEIYNTIEQNFADVGVTMTRVEFGPGQLIPALLGGEHEITYFTLATQPDWSAIQAYVAPGATWNPFGSTDPELEELISAMQNATEEDAVAAGQAVNAWLVDNNWFGVFQRSMATYATDAVTTVELQVGQASPSIYNYAPAK